MGKNSNKIKPGRSDRILRGFSYAVTSIWILALLFPMYWMVLTSVKDSASAYKNPPDFAPVVPKEYVINVDAGSKEYSVDEFVDDAIVMMWTTFSYFKDINIGKMTVNRVQDGRITYRVSMTSRFYKTSYTRVFPGEITPFSVRFKKKDILELMEKGKCFQKVSKSFSEGKSSGDADTIGRYINRLVLTDRDGDNERNPFTFANPVSSVNVRNSYSNLFDNYIVAFSFYREDGATFLRFLLNSFTVAAGAVLFQWLIIAAAAFGLSRLVSKRTARLLTTFFVATMMIPGIVSLIPLYNMVRRMGLVDNYLSILLPGIPNAVALVLLKGFFDDQPHEIAEAARIDGAGYLMTYIRIVIPLSLPVFGIIAILVFTGNWNDIVWPGMVLQSKKMQTFPVVINAMMGYKTEGKLDYPLILAMSAIAAIPTFILYVFFQRQMSAGIIFSGLKG